MRRAGTSTRRWPVPGSNAASRPCPDARGGCFRAGGDRVWPLARPPRAGPARGQRRDELAVEHAGPFLETDYWKTRVVGPLVDGQPVLHAGQKGGIHFAQVPVLLVLVLALVFCSTWLMVSCEMVSTRPNPTALSASSRRVQRRWPVGAGGQARALRRRGPPRQSAAGHRSAGPSQGLWPAPARRGTDAPDTLSARSTPTPWPRCSRSPRRPAATASARVAACRPLRGKDSGVVRSADNRSNSVIGLSIQRQ